MAEDPTEAEAGPPPPPPAPARPSVMAMVLPLIAVTAIAGAAGGGLGLLLHGRAAEAVSAARAAVDPKPQPQAKYAGSLLVHPIEPVVTNLAAPNGIWIRLELAMVFTAGALADPPVTAAEIRQDVIAYMRTLALTQLETPSALQHLREDINERAGIRSGGKVKEVVVQSMVVQ